VLNNEIDVEGLVATSTNSLNVHTEWLREVVRNYGKVLSNLVLHKSDLPTEVYLQSVVKSGRGSPS
jgi:hypothetical protein